MLPPLPPIGSLSTVISGNGLLFLQATGLFVGKQGKLILKPNADI
jgi:hypothetical protein